jgi:hypothetical protein
VNSNNASAPSASDLLPGLPDAARLWVFGIDRPLASAEEERFLREVDAFLASWKAHGSSLAVARDWRYGRFLLVGVDERIAPPSGCSIDALIGILRGLEGELGVEILGGGAIWYRDEAHDGFPTRVSREVFEKLAESGEISGDTMVFDLSLTRVGEAREGRWERPAREGWHRRYLR